LPAFEDGHRLAEAIIREKVMKPEIVKQTHELVAEGGKFYSIGHEQWCDTAIHSYKFVLNKGWVWQDDGGSPPAQPGTILTK
jgi:hypothetical protein